MKLVCTIVCKIVKNKTTEIFSKTRPDSSRNYIGLKMESSDFGNMLFPQCTLPQISNFLNVKT